jgi:O-antigen/teichoic acid export membrane protein
MIRTFARDALVYGAATILTRAASLLVVPIYTRFLSTADYGVIDLLTIAGNLILLTVALEISQAVARFLPEGDEDHKVAVASTALLFSVGMYALFAVAAIVAAPEIRSTLLDGAATDLTVRLAVVATVLNGIFQLTSGVLRFQLRPSQFAAASLTSSLGAIGLGVLLVAVAGIGVDGFFIGQIIGGHIGVGMTLAFSRGLYRPSFDPARLRSMLGFSVPLVPSSIGVFVFLFIDRLAISQLMTVSDVGVFGIGYRLASAVTLISFGAQMAVTPLVYARHEDPGTPAALERIFRYYVGGAAMLGLGLSLFAPEILMVLTTPSYFGAASVVPFLVPALILANLYVFMPGLGIAKRTTWFAIINLSGAVLNVALNFLLIPRLGIVGASLATLTSAGMVFAAYAVASQRFYPVPHEWARLASAAMVVTAVYLLVIQVLLELVPGVVLMGAGMVVALAAIAALGLLRRPPAAPVSPRPVASDP